MLICDDSGDVAEWIKSRGTRFYPKEDDLSNTRPSLDKMREAYHGDVAEWSKAPHC